MGLWEEIPQLHRIPIRCMETSSEDEDPGEVPVAHPMARHT